MRDYLQSGGACISGRSGRRDDLRSRSWANAPAPKWWYGSGRVVRARCVTMRNVDYMKIERRKIEHRPFVNRCEQPHCGVPPLCVIPRPSHACQWVTHFSTDRSQLCLMGCGPRVPTAAATALRPHAGALLRRRICRVAADSTRHVRVLWWTFRVLRRGQHVSA